VQLALDPNEHLVHVPLVAWPRPAAAHAVGEGLTELAAPAADALVRHGYPPFRQDKLDIPQTQAEYVV
jgi:hypothetical protein